MSTRAAPGTCYTVVLGIEQMVLTEHQSSHFFGSTRAGAGLCYMVILLAGQMVVTEHQSLLLLAHGSKKLGIIDLV